MHRHCRYSNQFNPTDIIAVAETFRTSKGCKEQVLLSLHALVVGTVIDGCTFGLRIFIFRISFPFPVAVELVKLLLRTDF